jgi:hypothetical protein
MPKINSNDLLIVLSSKIIAINSVEDAYVQKEVSGSFNIVYYNTLNNGVTDNSDETQ